MSWRNAFHKRFANLPAAIKDELFHSVNDDHTLAESLGFFVQFERVLGHGQAKYLKESEDTAVWLSANGWVRTTSLAAIETAPRYCFASLGQALRNEYPCKYIDERGHIVDVPVLELSPA